jgi:hypothetical protein
VQISIQGRNKLSGIGLLNEKPLHASLKQWYARPGDRFEVPVDGFVIDIVRGRLLIEIQTRNFASTRAKLIKLTGTTHLTNSPGEMDCPVGIS